MIDSSINSVIDGKREGYHKIFYDRNIILGCGNFINNNKEGLWLKYWNDGNLYNRGYYRNDEKIGYWEYYNRDGSLEHVDNNVLNFGMIRKYFINKGITYDKNDDYCLLSLVNNININTIITKHLK